MPKRTWLEIEGIKVEQRMSRSMTKAMNKVKASISIYELGLALQSKDAKKALALISASAIRDALVPCSQIASDAVIKGGRIAAKQMNG